MKRLVEPMQIQVRQQRRNDSPLRSSTVRAAFLLVGNQAGLFDGLHFGFFKSGVSDELGDGFAVLFGGFLDRLFLFRIEADRKAVIFWIIFLWSTAHTWCGPSFTDNLLTGLAADRSVDPIGRFVEYVFCHGISFLRRYGILIVIEYGPSFEGLLSLGPLLAMG